MHKSTKKWLFIKCSSALLIPLMAWFILNAASLYDSDYDELLVFFTSQPSNLLFSVFVIFAFFFYALTISEIFEDYIDNRTTKFVANKVLNIFAILMPLITIISLFNLSL